MAPVPTPGYPVATATSLPSLSSAKVVGGIGCILLFLVFAPQIGALVGLAGLIMIGFALYRISEVTGERGIFSNFLYAAVAAVVGLAVGIFVVIAGVLQVLGFENLANQDWAGWTPTPGQGVELALFAIGGLIIMWGALLVSALFVKRAADLVGTRLNIRLFQTAGLVYLIGAGLTVVLVGFLLVAVALLIFAVGFFTIPDRPPVPVPPAPWAPPAPPPPPPAWVPPPPPPPPQVPGGAR